jgi:hypothetical protein
MARRDDPDVAFERERLVLAAAAMPVAVERFRVSWGGVWSGFLVSLAVSILLGALGLAVGVTVADIGPDAGPQTRGLGLGAGIWVFVTLLFSLFAGGMVASHAGAVIERSTAATQGVLVWVLAILATAVLAASGIGLGANALVHMTGGVAPEGGSAMLSDLTTGNVDGLRVQVNDPKTASALAGLTGMPLPEVQRILSDASARLQADRTNPARALAEARTALMPITDRLQRQAAEAMAQAKPYATATGWATFVTLVLSLGAAVMGALAGARRLAHVP